MKTRRADVRAYRMKSSAACAIMRPVMDKHSQVESVLHGQVGADERWLLLVVDMTAAAWLNVLEGPRYVDRWMAEIGEVVAAHAGAGLIHRVSDEFWVLWPAGPQAETEAKAVGHALAYSKRVSGRTHAVIVEAPGREVARLADEALHRHSSRIAIATRDERQSGG